MLNNVKFEFYMLIAVTITSALLLIGLGGDYNYIMKRIIVFFMSWQTFELYKVI